VRDLATARREPQPSDRPPGGASDTKARLLDAAELFFAERGFDGMSMRAVTNAAGVSVSAANYHFGSKLALMGAALRRRVEPINRRRFELLDGLEAEASVPNVEQVLDAFYRPPFEQAAESTEAQRTLMRTVAARLWHDPAEMVAAIRVELFGEVSERFSVALVNAMPEIEPARARMLLQLSVGLLIQTLNGEAASFFSTDADTLRAVLVRYATAGVIAAAQEDPS